MIVTVKLFAGARDLTGREAINLELPDDATVADVRRGIARRYPTARSLLARSAMALNHDFALDSDAVQANSELAVIPPVSGG